MLDAHLNGLPVCECAQGWQIRYRAANSAEAPRRMYGNKPDMHYFPKQHRRPKDTPSRLTPRPKIRREPFWQHPLYLAIWERLPNGLQIRLLECEARLERRQQRLR